MIYHEKINMEGSKIIKNLLIIYVKLNRGVYKRTRI